MIGFCKVIDFLFLDIQWQANIEKQLISYENMEELFSDLAGFLVVQEIAARTWWNPLDLKLLNCEKLQSKY